MVLRHNEKVLPEFLFALLKSNYVISELQHLAETRSGTFPQITFSSELSPMRVKIPDKETQKQIISVLSSIEKKININDQVNNNLEQQARSLFKSWFVDFLPFGGKMPAHWSISPLSSIAKISKEVFSPQKNPNIEVEHYSIPAYDECCYPVFEISNGIKSNKYKLSAHSVIISKLNPDTKRIWRPYCLSNSPICSTEFIVYEPIVSAYRDFVYSVIDSDIFSAFLCSHATGSTNSRQRVTPSVTLNYDVVLPDAEVLKRFCAMISPMYEMIKNNILENKRLAKTRDILLPKLMSGEIDVSDIDI